MLLTSCKFMTRHVTLPYVLIDRETNFMVINFRGKASFYLRLGAFHQKLPRSSTLRNQIASEEMANRQIPNPSTNPADLPPPSSTTLKNLKHYSYTA